MENQNQIDRLTAALMRAAVESLMALKQSGISGQLIGSGKQYPTDQEWVDATIAIWMGEEDPKPKPVLPPKRVRFLDSVGQWREGTILSQSEATRSYEVEYQTVTGPKIVTVDIMRCQPK